MLRQLAAGIRPVLQRHPLIEQSPYATQTQLYLHNTAVGQGLEEFFEAPLAEGDKPRTGDADSWAAAPCSQCFHPRHTAREQSFTMVQAMTCNALRLSRQGLEGS